MQQQKMDSLFKRNIEARMGPEKFINTLTRRSGWLPAHNHTSDSAHIESDEKDGVRTLICTGYPASIPTSRGQV